MKICNHCKRETNQQLVRTLCPRCYHYKDIRAQYKPKIKYFGTNDDTINEPKLPEKPTKAAPGSLEKIAVMEQRRLNNEQLFHPEDTKI